MLPAGCLWTALRPVEGFKYDETIEELKTIYPPGPGEDVEMDQDDPSYCILPESVPAPIREMAEDKLAIESLGTMIWYLRQLNIDKDILTMKNFNVYDPMKRGMGLTLDGQTLSHLEVKMRLILPLYFTNIYIYIYRFCSTMKEQTRDRYSNFLGGASRLLASGSSESGFVCPCARSPILTRGTPSFFCHVLCAEQSFGRLDAVEDIISHPTFESTFTEVAKGIPDLERIVSRIHAKTCKVRDFLKVLKVEHTIR